MGKEKHPRFDDIPRVAFRIVGTQEKQKKTETRLLSHLFDDAVVQCPVALVHAPADY